MSEIFPRSWSAEILRTPPLILPARQYVWPRFIAGEEDALARGALLVTVKAGGSSYLLTCALGFRDPSMPSGVFSCPNPDQICAVAGGYAYIADARSPEQVVQVEMKPVVAIHSAVPAGLLLFVGFQTVIACGAQGKAWETRRLSWEGVRLTEIQQDVAIGFGWDLMADKEVEFRVDLATGEATGGGFRPQTHRS